MKREIVIFSIDVSLKTFFSIVLSFEFFGISNFCRKVHPLNVFSAIFMRLSGHLTLFIEVYANAYLSIISILESA